MIFILKLFPLLKTLWIFPVLFELSKNKNNDDTYNSTRKANKDKFLW